MKESNHSKTLNLKHNPNELASTDKNSERIETADALFLSVVKRPRMYPKLESNLSSLGKHQPHALDGDNNGAGSSQLPSPFEEPVQTRFTVDCEPKPSLNSGSSNQNKVRVSKSCPRPFSIDRVPSVINGTKLPITVNTNNHQLSGSVSVSSANTHSLAHQLIEQHILAPNLMAGSGFQKPNQSVKLRTGISLSGSSPHGGVTPAATSLASSQLPPMDQPQVQDVSIKYLTYDELTEPQSPSALFRDLESALSADKEWGSLFENLNTLRSLVKFNEKLFADNQNLLVAVFKKVCYLVVNKRSAVAKNALICLQEAVMKLGQQLQKIVEVLVQYLFAKLSDSNNFMLAEVDKCLQHVITYMHAAKTLCLLMGYAEHKNQVIRASVAKSFGKLFERIQKGIFFFKDYDRLIKCLGQLTRDSCLEVRNQAKESTKVLSDLSDSPEAVIKAIMQPQSSSFTAVAVGPSSIQTSTLLRQSTVGGTIHTADSQTMAIRPSPSALAGVSALPDERQSSPPPFSKKITIAVAGAIPSHQPYVASLAAAKNGIKLKRFSSNTLVALNRTEEFMKENPPISKRAKKAYITEENMPKVMPADQIEEGTNPATFAKVSGQPLIQPQKNETILSRNRRPQIAARNFPELDIIPDLIKDIQDEDWQGKVESLATAVAIIKEHGSKFMRSVHLPKFFDMLLELLQGNNQKMQIETLTTLKTDLRQIFKNLPERLLSLLVECLFKLQGSNNPQIKSLAADCLINLRDYDDKSRVCLTAEVLQTTINRQYVNLSIKAKSNFAKYLADNASRLDESVMTLVHPVLLFNICNANSELKRLNEHLFRELYATYGEGLLHMFDEKTKELVMALLKTAPAPLVALAAPQHLPTNSTTPVV